MTQVSEPTTQGDVNQAVSIIVQDKLEKENVTEKFLNELKSDLQNRADIEITDKASLQLVQDGITNAVKVRSKITQLCKKGREAAIAEQRAWINAEREYISTFEAEEKRLRDKKDLYIAQQEELERQRLEAEANAIRERIKAIVDLGFALVPGVGDQGDSYRLEGTVIEGWKIAGAEDAEWQNLLRSAQVVAAEYAERQEEEQAMAAQIAQQNAEEAQRLQAEQDRLARERQEHEQRVAAFNSKINEARKNELLAIGCEVREGTIGAPGSVVGLNLQELHTQDDETWSNNVEFLKVGVEAYRVERERIAEAERVAAEERAAFAARQSLITTRTKALKDAGWELVEEEGHKPYMKLRRLPPDQGILLDHVACSDEQFVEHVAIGNTELARRKQVEEAATRERILAEERERQQRESVQAEADRVAKEAAMSDEQKILSWVKLVREGAPKLQSAIGQSGVAALTNNFAQSCEKMIKDIKA